MQSKHTRERLQGRRSEGRRRSSNIDCDAAPETLPVSEVFYRVRKGRSDDGTATVLSDTGPLCDRFKWSQDEL